MSFDKKNYQREYMRKKRAKEYAEKFPGEATETDEAHPIFPNLKRHSNRTYDEKGLVLIEQRCPLEGCKGIWSASIEIECPYCRGTGTRIHTNRN